MFRRPANATTKSIRVVSMFEASPDPSSRGINCLSIIVIQRETQRRATPTWMCQYRVRARRLAKVVIEDALIMAHSMAPHAATGHVCNERDPFVLFRKGVPMRVVYPGEVTMSLSSKTTQSERAKFSRYLSININ